MGVMRLFEFFVTVAQWGYKRYVILCGVYLGVDLGIGAWKAGHLNPTLWTFRVYTLGPLFPRALVLDLPDCTSSLQTSRVFGHPQPYLRG